jgi:hypothetical protein
MASIKWLMVLGILILVSSISFSTVIVTPGYGYPNPFPGSSGGETILPKVDINVTVLCNETIITVTSPKTGLPLKSAIMVDTVTAIYYMGETGEDGTIVIPSSQLPRCGTLDVEFYANPRVKGYEHNSVRMAFSCPENCGQTGTGCPNGEVKYQERCVQCVSDSDCSTGLVCKANSCTSPPAAAPTGNQTGGGPTCTAPGCCTQDNQCGDGKFCEISPTAVSGKCSPIVCGTVVNHQLVPYECGIENGCRSCIAPRVCEQNTCHLYGVQCPLTSANVGDTLTCTATRDGVSCDHCSGTFVGPNGDTIPFTTDSDGHFTINLSQVGSYKIVLSGAGANVLVKGPAGPTGGTPQGGQQSGGSILWYILIILLLIILAGGAAYWVFVMGPKKK